MCSPALVMVGATLVGGAMQAQGQREAANAQANAAEANAKIGEVQAQQAREIGGMEEQRVLRQMRRTLGAQRAGFAAANVDPSQGSALDIQLETAQEAKTDAEIARANAMRQAWGFDVEASQQRTAAKVVRREGAQQARTTLLTSASRAYGGYYRTG